MQQAIEREITINAPIATVWEVITNPTHIAHWYCDDAELDLHEGGRGRLVWNKQFDYEQVLTVVKVDKPTMFAFRWVYPEGQEPNERNSLLVEFALSEEDGRTKVHLTESGFAVLPWNDDQKAAYIADHNQGWDAIMNALGQYASSVSK